MSTVKHYCVTVSGQLNDQRPQMEFMRWTRENMVEYLNEGLKEVAAYKPDAFARTLALPLVAGRVQKLPEGVLLRGIGAGRDGRMAHASEDTLLKSFTPYAPCPPRPQMKNGKLVYSVRSFAVDSADPSLFYVSPPVPIGVTVQVQAQVDGATDTYTLADWEKEVRVADKYYNNILDYMMARAYMLDSESQVAAAQSASLLRQFYNSMGVKYKAEAARNSGYENGKIGTGDLRSARV